MCLSGRFSLLPGVTFPVLRFLCYVSSVMCPVICFLVKLIICDKHIWILPCDCGDVELWSYSVGRLVNNRDWWRVSDVLTATCIINVYFLLVFFASLFLLIVNCLKN